MIAEYYEKKTLTKQRNVTAKACINPEPSIILNFFQNPEK